MQPSGIQLPNVTVEDLFKARVHFGHRARYQNPSMAPYRFGTAQGLQIIDLNQTLPLLQKALQFIASVVAKRGNVLFVGTKQAAATCISDHAVRCNMPYVKHRWIPGTLTNYNKILKPIKTLHDLEAKIDSGFLANLTKKEGLTLIRKKDKLERDFSGIKEMKGLPDALFIVDVGQEQIALLEANKLGIPVVGIVDTNNSPEGVDYMIPGNDDAFRAIDLYTRFIADVILDAKQVAKLDEPTKGEEKPAAPKVNIIKKKVVTRPKKVQVESVRSKIAAAATENESNEKGEANESN